MKIIFWPNKAPQWSRPPCPECGAGKVRGYEAGEIVAYNGNDYVCVNAHQRSTLAPSTSSLWARVLR